MTATSRAPRGPLICPRGRPRSARRAACAPPPRGLPPRARPLPAPQKRFNFPPALAPPPESDAIPSHALVSGDADAALQAVIAAAESGAFRVMGAIGAREVRDAVEAASGAVFVTPVEVKCGLRRWLFRRRDGASEEFFWFQPMSVDEDRTLPCQFLPPLD